MPAPANTVQRRNRTNQNRQKMMVAQSLDPKLLRDQARDDSTRVRQSDKSRKTKKMMKPPEKSPQGGLFGAGSKVHLPKLAGDTDSDFVKHFLVKNNKPFV